MSSGQLGFGFDDEALAAGPATPPVKVRKTKAPAANAAPEAPGRAAMRHGGAGVEAVARAPGP